MLAFIKDPHTRTALIASFILILIGLAIAYVKLVDIDYLLVIHFDAYRGIDFLGNRAEVFGILVTALIIGVVNFLLAGVFYHRERFLSYVLSYCTIFFSLLILIAAMVIISIN